MAKDPVCGMTVKEDGLKSIHNGEIYYFCSDFCKNLFEKEPGKYVDLIRISAAPAAEKERSIAYFTMEIGLDPRIPTYSGGLGILAGDTLKSCADLKVPIVGITLLYQKGYFYQKLDDQGNQYELPVQWNPKDYVKPLSEKIEVRIEGRSVGVKAWQYDICCGISGYSVPVIFLDTDLGENSEFDRGLTSYLYGGDEKYRLAQEIILGIGGIKMLRKLGYTGIKKYHMNEGRVSLPLIPRFLRVMTGSPTIWLKTF